MSVLRKSNAGSVLRHRNFALLFSGQAVSLAGNGAFMVALPLEVLQLTSSPLALALVVSGQTASTVLLLLIGGTLVDRLSRRLLMLMSDTVCGVSVSLMTILVIIREVYLWELFLLSVIFGAAGAFFKPAATAIVRDILPSELLVSASSLSSFSQSLASMQHSRRGARQSRLLLSLFHPGAAPRQEYLSRWPCRAWHPVCRQRRRRYSRLSCHLSPGDSIAPRDNDLGGVGSGRYLCCGRRPLTVGMDVSHIGRPGVGPGQLRKHLVVPAGPAGNTAGAAWPGLFG